MLIMKGEEGNKALFPFLGILIPLLLTYFFILKLSWSQLFIIAKQAALD